MTVSIRGNIIKNRFPIIYHNSEVLNQLWQSSGHELDILFQLYSELFLGSFVRNADWSIAYWEDIFDIPNDDSISLELRKAKILSFTVIHQRIRRVDIEAVVREYLDGPQARVLDFYGKTVKVDTVSGFVVGQPIYIGGDNDILASINVDTNELTVQDNLHLTYPHALVSQTPVIIIESFADYIFSVIVEENDILDQNLLIDAVERAKPAHLGWRLYSTEPGDNQFFLDNPDSLTESPDDLTDVFSTLNLLYENVG